MLYFACCTAVMQNTFKSLQFDVSIHQNLWMNAFKKLMAETACFDHSAFDALVVVIITHGDNGHLYFYGEKIEIIKVVEMFNEWRCPTLAGKQKMFFIQACLGEYC